MRIDRDVLRRVAAMKLTAPRHSEGPLQGDRRSPRRGRGVEFADYRPYTPGDDLRLVDWNVYGRLEQLLVRLFHEDLNMTAQIWVDASASMGFGTPRKADHAANLAACVALLGLKHQDSVTLGCVGGEGPRLMASGQNTGAFGQFVRLLEQVEPGGAAPTWRALRAARGRKKADRLFLVSDMLQEPEDVEQTLRMMAATSKAPVLLHVLGEEELSPDLRDAQRITDAETGEELLIAGGRQAEEEYARALEEWLELLRGRCRRLGVTYVPAHTELSVDEAVVHLMRRAGATQSATGVV